MVGGRYSWDETGEETWTEFCDLTNDEFDCTEQSSLYGYTNPLLFKVENDLEQTLSNASCLPEV